MENNNELEQIFDALKAEHDIENLATFSEMDIADKLQTNEMMTIKYKELYFKELQVYEDLESKMEMLIGLRYKHYRFNDDHEWTKPEIEKYCIPADEKIVKMKKIMAKQQVRVRFFEMCYKAFEKMSWNMKCFTDRERMGL